VSLIIRSPYPDIAIPEVCLPEFLFAERGTDDADRPAVIDTSCRGYSYGQLTAAIGRVAAGLAERGLGRHDVAVIFSPNCPDYPAVFHGVLGAGAVCSPANALTPAELAHQLRDSGARVLVASADSLDRARAVVAEGKVRVEEIIVLGSARGAPGPVRETGFDELLACTVPTPKAVLGGDDLAALSYSSGTTGLSKGVMPTHRNLVAGVLQTQPLNLLGPDSRMLAVLPLFHIHGVTGLMNGTLYSRGRIVTMPRFDHQVAPAELEALLLTHGGISDAAVVEVHHDGVEVPKALVVRRATHPGLDAEEVQVFVAARVAPYKKVRLVEFLDQIPKSYSADDAFAKPRSGRRVWHRR
jgi:acyl-CoA synthetase (AMP-forming)/AMP-acid ligase II